MHRVPLTLLAIAALACDGTTAPRLPDGHILLTTSQASLIAARAESMAAAHGELDWLADSIAVIVHAGAEAVRLPFTVDGQERPHYALGLQRRIEAGGTGFATWHVLAFDAPDDPRSFIVANGYAPGIGTTIPIGVSGPLGGSSVFFHLLEIAANGAVADWRGTQGNASFSSSPVTGAACPGFAGPSGTTCVTNELAVLLNVTQAIAVPATPPRTVTLGATMVPGIRLNFQ